MRKFKFLLYVGNNCRRIEEIECVDIDAAVMTAWFFLSPDADTFYDYVRFYIDNPYQIHTTVYKCERYVEVTERIGV